MQVRQELGMDREHGWRLVQDRTPWMRAEDVLQTLLAANLDTCGANPTSTWSARCTSERSRQELRNGVVWDRKLHETNMGPGTNTTITISENLNCQGRLQITPTLRFAPAQDPVQVFVISAEEKAEWAALTGAARGNFKSWLLGNSVCLPLLSLSRLLCSATDAKRQKSAVFVDMRIDIDTI